MQNLEERILVANGDGGGREELNKAPILLHTGAGNRTPLSKVTGGVEESGVAGGFYTPVTSQNPEHTLLT